MVKNKVFFFDMDGTLLGQGLNMKISFKDIYALNQLEILGYDVVLNTGKCYNMCEKQFEQFNFKYSITSNGQVLMHKKSVVYSGEFTGDQIDFWVDYAFKNDLVIGFQAKDRQCVLNSPNALLYTHQCFNELNVPIPIIVEEIKEHSNVQQIWLLGEIDNLVLRNDYDYFKWHKNGLDVQIKGINKGLGVKKFLEYKNYKDFEIYAFGDGMNDLPMFEYADVCVAMKNACETVKKQANFVTSSVYESGVYEFLVKNKIIDKLN